MGNFFLDCRGFSRAVGGMAFWLHPFSRHERIETATDRSLGPEPLLIYPKILLYKVLSASWGIFNKSSGNNQLQKNILAFGTGIRTTTPMCLCRLARIPPEGLCIIGEETDPADSVFVGRAPEEQETTEDKPLALPEDNEPLAPPASTTPRHSRSRFPSSYCALLRSTPAPSPCANSRPPNICIRTCRPWTSCRRIRPYRSNSKS